MIRKAIIVLLTVACFGSLAFDIANRCGWAGVHWNIHDDQFQAVEPAERIWLLTSPPGSLAIGYEQLVKQAPTWRMIDLGIATIRIRDSQLFYAGGWRKEIWRSTVVTIPFWFIGLLLGIWPTVAFLRGPCRRRGRRTKGSCRKCGYNLTGNVSGVCPECGSAVPVDGSVEAAVSGVSSGAGRAPTGQNG